MNTITQTSCSPIGQTVETTPHFGNNPETPLPWPCRVNMHRSLCERRTRLKEGSATRVRTSASQPMSPMAGDERQRINCDESHASAHALKRRSSSCFGDVNPDRRPLAISQPQTFSLRAPRRDTGGARKGRINCRPLESSPSGSAPSTSATSLESSPRLRAASGSSSATSHGYRQSTRALPSPTCRACSTT